MIANVQRHSGTTESLFAVDLPSGVPFSSRVEKRRVAGGHGGGGGGGCGGEWEIGVVGASSVYKLQ